MDIHCILVISRHQRWIQRIADQCDCQPTLISFSSMNYCKLKCIFYIFHWYIFVILVHLILKFSLFFYIGVCIYLYIYIYFYIHIINTNTKIGIDTKIKLIKVVEEKCFFGWGTKLLDLNFMSVQLNLTLNS